jgi:hypothetical protein
MNQDKMYLNSKNMIFLETISKALVIRIIFLKKGVLFF